MEFCKSVGLDITLQEHSLRDNLPFITGSKWVPKNYNMLESYLSISINYC